MNWTIVLTLLVAFPADGPEAARRDAQGNRRELRLLILDQPVPAAGGAYH